MSPIKEFCGCKFGFSRLCIWFFTVQIVSLRVNRIVENSYLMKTSIFTILKDTLAAIALIVLAASCSGQGEELHLTHAQLMDKIKGGWAGQTIGVTYGGPTEFRYQGKMMSDEEQVPWSDENQILMAMDTLPGLYDDIYMDLTFVEVFNRLGIDAPVDSLALAFAHAGYDLWHANQAARYNILNGIMPPESGHWLNNPHADDIDYQIEADFAGLMSPAMPNTASEISDRVGHIMTYGDGWYGGVFMGAMYSIAFTSSDVEYIVTEALKTIPTQSRFYRCISDVVASWREHPDSWRTTWQMLDERWDNDVACLSGALSSFNIDATLNSAYVVIGLLYGGGDFGRTIDISMRCGQDSDCNPSSAAGILGTAIGYENIPEEWIAPLRKAEDVKFAYTSSSLNDTYRQSYEQALQVIEREGGKINDKGVVIKMQQPQAVRFEQSFPSLQPSDFITIDKLILAEPTTFTASCAGIEIRGLANGEKDYVAQVEITVDGQSEVVKMPTDWSKRRLEIYWNFTLEQGEHTISMRWLNPEKGAAVYARDALLLDKTE